MTESAKIAAYNALTEQKGAADAAFNRGMADLNNYVREQEKTEQDALYNEIMTTIDSQTWNTTAELSNYLFGEDGQSGVAAGLSDSQRAQVQQRLDFYRNNRDQQAADAAFNADPISVSAVEGLSVNNDSLNEKDTDGSEKFSVKDGNGKKYRVKSSQQVSSGDNEIAKAIVGSVGRNKLTKGAIYQAGDELYAYIGTDAAGNYLFANIVERDHYGFEGKSGYKALQKYLKGEKKE